MLKRIHYILSCITLVVGLLCLPMTSWAQQSRCSISGYVRDQQQSPVPYASVAVYDAETPVTGVITDDEGKFSLKLAKSDITYRLVVEFIGYTKYSQDIRLDKAHVDLGTIILKEDAVALEGATVSAKEISRKSSVEHTSINASANLISDKGTALDILRAASSVSISKDEISIRGNSNILVLMDGVPTTASDLTSIPAANIKNIEVITNPDASYDASGTGGIINIISKKASLEGFSGVIAANYGFNHFVNANAAFTYNQLKTSYRFSYNTKYEDDVLDGILQRKVKAGEYDLYQQMQTNRYTYNNNIAFGTDLRLNSRNRLSLDARCIIPRINMKQNLHNSYTYDGSTNEEFRHNDVTWNRENIEASIAYTHVIRPDISDVSVKASVSKIWGHRPSLYYVGDEMLNRSNSGGSPFISALQLDYKNKYKAGTLSTGVKITYRLNDIYHQFYELHSGEWEYSESLSNDLLHTETVPAAYVMFASKAGKKFSYKTGLRAELSSVTLTSTHDAVDESNAAYFLAPSLSGTYKISKDQELSLALSRRIGRPSYPQLNPYMSMVDANTFEQGNMHLQPEKSTKLDLSYSIGKGSFNLFADCYINHTVDYISQITSIEADRLITTYVNAESDLKSGLDLSLRIMPAKWFNLSVASNTWYVSTVGEYRGAEISNAGLTNNSNIMLDFLPWKGADIQCQYFVTTPQYFPQLTTALTHQMNMGMKQRLLKGSLTLSILLTDVFKTAVWEVYSNNNIFDLRNISRNKSQMLWLGLSYNFNSFKQKAGQKAESDRALIRLGL